MGESKSDDEKKYSPKDTITDEDLALSFVEDRHLVPGIGSDCMSSVWRMKERMKTVGVALVLCLNVGVDPPDVVKTQPCARLECWIDPTSMSASKALEKIGQSLQSQYERWQPRARYKQSLDPTAEDVKKLCTSLRRNAKEERVLFHYNGHGVPKPTSNGEIWVFNRNFTQYIPLSIYDLQTWVGAPSIYVYDCSNAGVIVDSFKQFANQHQTEYEQSLLQQPNNQRLLPQPSYHNCIQLAACSAKQSLPMTPELPADLFTSCLTTPIQVALRWYVLQPSSKVTPKVTLDLIDKIPGQITDRRTMLGELNWIFTAVTDTIAWNTLPRDLFQKLFRQDLLVASLFRNFLLAERIMRSCDCTPISSPALPPTFQHPMWAAWDLALDLSLGQLPDIVLKDEPFKHLGFFEEQLTAFQVWLELGSVDRNPPEQLPIVLQVLLSQIHRTRALELLGKFLDMGPWAVNLALSVGIFPYVLKLLQSSAPELKYLLLDIWTKILAVDLSCQADLVREKGFAYFWNVFNDDTLSREQRMQATFIVSCLVDESREGQEVALKDSMVNICLEHLQVRDNELRQWRVIFLGKLWNHYEKARWAGARDSAHEKLFNLLKDPCPEVRAAAVFSLGTFINSVKERSEHANSVDFFIAVTLVSTASRDMSPLVRMEIVSALQWIVVAFEPEFVNVALSEQGDISPGTDCLTLNTNSLKRIGSRDRLKNNDSDSLDRMKRVASSSSINSIGSHMTQSYSGSISTLSSIGYGSFYLKIWGALCSLENDPHPEVAQLTAKLTGHIRALVKEKRESTENRLNSLNNSSLSLPPSPNRGNYFAGESPPTLHPHRDINRSVTSNRSRRPHKISIDDGENKEQRCRKPVVQTKFLQWSALRFVLSNMKNKKTNDKESPRFHEKDWRKTRNNNIRAEAIEEQRRALNSKIESQTFHIRTPVSPNLLKLHPFDQQIAVAGKNSFAIFDWGTGAKTTSGQIKASRQVRITALEWINGHDIGMISVASDDGSVRFWRPNAGISRDPTLVTAWQAFSDAKYKSSGIVMTWEQWTQTLITSGDSRNIRFWDAEREMKAMDLPTGTDKPVTCIDSTFSSICHENSKKNHHLLGIEDDFICDNLPLYHGPKLGMCAIGCADGSVRLFDRRCSPNEARIMVWSEHPASVLNIQLRDNLIVSGSSAGDVRIYDVRKVCSIHTTQAVQNYGMSCLSIHRSANVYACGSTNQFISIYKLKGTLINTIRIYEGFMGPRIGPVTCLDYHPHRVVLAAGTADCCVNVYTLDGVRR